jgi:hypothetical protein
MRKGALRPEATAALPWLAAGVLWFGLITPMRADQETLLGEQSRIRRDRVKNDRSARETKTLSTRAAAALGSACRASTDPAMLRQRVVAATAGLELSPFALSVTGGPAGGAQIETEGPRAHVLELLRRLGDPARGGFLRTVTVRQAGSRWNASVATGLVGTAPAALLRSIPACGASPDLAPAETPLGSPDTPTPTPEASRAARPSPPMAIPPPVFVPAAEPAAPLTLIAFLRTDGKSRVSIRAGADVHIISVGDRILGWTCASIDRDEGAVFTSPEGARLVLRAVQDEGH